MLLSRRLFFSFFIYLPAICIFSYSKEIYAQGTWIQKANFPGIARFGAVGFSIGSKGYIGTGSDVGNSASAFHIDFWEWDQPTNSWTQKADFAGAARRGAVGFSIESKGYVGTGQVAGGGYTQDFWEYDPTINTWTPKAAFAGGTRGFAAGFSIESKGYICTGESSLAISVKQYNDLWEYNPVTDLWTSKAVFTGPERSGPGVGICIGNKAYVGTGFKTFSSTAIAYYNDFWEWDPGTNVWTQKANFAGAPRCEGVGFAIATSGFVGTGTTNRGVSSVADFWRYDVSTNLWSPVTNFGGGVRECAVAFTIGCKGYVGTGFINDKTIDRKKDLWEFTPNPDPCNTISVTAAASNPLCNGQCTGTASAFPSEGFVQYTYNWSNGKTTSSISGLCAGLYTILITDSLGYTASTNIDVIAPQTLSVTVNSLDAACNGNTGISTMIPSGGTAPYSYSWNNGQTSQTISGLSIGTYTCTVIDAHGCTKTQMDTISTVFPIPLTTTATPNSIFSGDTSQIVAEGGTDYLWSPTTGLSCTTCPNPVAAPDQTTTYCVTAIDSNGCPTTGCVTIEITCRSLFLPNAFSPNGDGDNDALFVYGDCIKNIHLIIYNRWGEQVFETRDQLVGWDGTFQGIKENTATFAYFLSITFTNGKMTNQKGNISLLH